MAASRENGSGRIYEWIAGYRGAVSWRLCLRSVGLDRMLSIYLEVMGMNRSAEKICRCLLEDRVIMRRNVVGIV